MKKSFNKKKITFIFVTVLVAFFVFNSFIFLNKSKTNINNQLVTDTYTNSLLYENDNSASTTSSIENSYSTSSSIELPEKYSLYSFSSYTGISEGLPSNVGNQRSTNLCWAFSSITAFESSLYKMGKVSTTDKINYSEIDLAYYVYVTSRNYNSVGGGSFEFALEYLTTSGPVVEQSWENPSVATSSSLTWTSDSNIVSSYEEKLQTYEPVSSNFVALETYYFPSRSVIINDAILNGQTDEEIDEQVLNLRNSIKQHIYTYGAVTSSIYYNSAYLSNGISYIYNGSTNVSQNHMITLVGWDDNITYNNHKGAYIAQNSYGSDYGKDGYFYIFYDDLKVENNVCGFVRIEETLDQSYTYDNLENSEYQNRFVILNGNYYSTSYVNLGVTTYLSNVYKTKSISGQNIMRIKVPTMSVVSYDNETGLSIFNYNQTRFRLYVIDNLTYEDFLNLETSLSNKFNDKIAIQNKYATGSDKYLFTSNQTGFYTVELVNKIELTGDYFAVIMEVTDGILYFMPNNPDGEITNPTFYSTVPNSSWGIYQTQTDECVFPMVVETSYNNIEYTCQDVVKEYDGKNVEPNIIVNSDTTYKIYYSLDNSSWSSTMPEIKNVLLDQENNVTNYIVYIKITSNFYPDAYDSFEVLINPRQLTLTPLEKEKVYGNIDPNITCRIDNLVDGEEPLITGRLSREMGEDVGKYPINIGSYTLNNSDTFTLSNYTINFIENINFTIIERDLYIIPYVDSKVYGEQDPTFRYALMNLAQNESPESGYVYFEREKGENVGDYNYLNFSCEFDDSVLTAFKSSNYNFIFNPTGLTFNILKRDLIITPQDNQSKIYGDDDPELLYSYSNLVEDETPLFTGSLSREQGETVGYYKYDLGSLTLNDGTSILATNYNLVLDSNSSEFFISNGEIKGITLQNQTFVYDGQEHFLTPTFSSDFVGDVTIRYCYGEEFIEDSAENENIAKKDVGSYNITFEFSIENYYNLYLTSTLVIEPRELIVTPLENQSKIYGEDNNIQYNYSNAVANEVPNFAGELSINNQENAGSYVITAGNLSLVDNGNFLASNYFISFKNEDNISYQIEKRDIVITPKQNQSKMYGKQDGIIEYVIDQLCFEDKYDLTGSLQRLSGEDVGEYLITIGTMKLGTSLENNYNLVFSDEQVYYEITKAPLKIKILDVNDYYGKLNFNYSYKIYDEYLPNFVVGDNLEISYICLDNNGQPISNETKREVNGYEITAVSGNENYSCEFVSGRYYIYYENLNVYFKVFDIVYQLDGGVEQFSKVKEVPQTVITDIDGYEFLWWEVNGLRKVVTDYEIKEETTFVAKMAEIVYNINYHLDGGSFTDEAKSTYTINDNFVLNSPQKEGYSFVGFYDNSLFDGEIITEIELGSTGNIELYAKYEVNVFEVVLPSTSSSQQIVGQTQIEYGQNYNFDVILSSEYDKSYATMQVFAVFESGNKIELQPVYSSYDKQSYSINSVKESFEIEVVGISKNIYVVSFFADNQIIGNYTVEHGNDLDITLPTIPTKEHYDDTAPTWSIQEFNNVTSDTVVEAIYTPDIYNITFVLPNDKQLQTQVVYGQDVSTQILNDNYSLGLLEYFVFDKSLTGIDKDTTINVSIGSNMYIIYIIVAITITFIIIGVAVSIVRKHKRKKFNWWAYAKNEVPNKDIANKK